MIFEDVNIKENDKYIIFEATIKKDSNTIIPYFKLKKNKLIEKVNFENFNIADIFMPILTIASMYYNENLIVKIPISLKIQNNLPYIQAILNTWYKEMHLINIDLMETKNATIKYLERNNICLFYSGGIDSLYTLTKYTKYDYSLNKIKVEGSLKYLINIAGLDTPLEKTTINSDDEKKLIKTTQDMGLNILFAETNIRNLFEIPYGQYFHGACLCSTANLFGMIFNKVLISSSHSYNEMIPWGSHPLLDSLWSSDNCQILHDGSEKTRIEKLEYLILNQPLTKNILRSCLKNKNSYYNCGKCKKCIQIMLVLDALGILVEFKTFPNQINTNYIEILENSLWNEHYQLWLKSLIEFLKDKSYKKEIIFSLEKLYKRQKIKYNLL